MPKKKNQEKIPELLDRETVKERRKDLKDPMRAAGQWYHDNYVEGQGVVFPDDEEEVYE